MGPNSDIMMENHSVPSYMVRQNRSPKKKAKRSVKINEPQEYIKKVKTKSVRIKTDDDKKSRGRERSTSAKKKKTKS